MDGGAPVLLVRHEPVGLALEDVGGVGDPVGPGGEQGAAVVGDRLSACQLVTRSRSPCRSTRRAAARSLISACMVPLRRVNCRDTESFRRGSGGDGDGLLEVIQAGPSVRRRPARPGGCRAAPRAVQCSPDAGDQQLGHLPAHLLDRLVDGGQRRLGVPGHGRVVEADHRDVARAPAGPPRAAPASRRAPSGRRRRTPRPGRGAGRAACASPPAPLASLKSPYATELVAVHAGRRAARRGSRPAGRRPRPCPAGRRWWRSARRPSAEQVLDRLPGAARCRRRRSCQAGLSADAAGRRGRPARRVASSSAGSGSAPCSDSSSTPSTCWPVRWCSTRSRSAATAPSPATAAAASRAAPELMPRTIAGEERLGEDPLLRLGDDQRHRVGALGDQRAGGPVGHVAQLLRSPAARRPRASGLTCGEPLTTRDTVPRPTPATRRHRVQRRPPGRPGALRCHLSPLAMDSPASLSAGPAQAVPPDHLGSTSWRSSSGLRSLASRSRRGPCRTAWRSPTPTRSCPSATRRSSPRSGTPAADRLVAGAQVGVQVGDPVRGRATRRRRRPTSSKAAPFSVMYSGTRRVLGGDPVQHLRQARRVDLPAHLGHRPPALDEPHVLAARPRRRRRQCGAAAAAPAAGAARPRAGCSS